ncbi:MAG: anti-sigma factor, partial [Shewanella sp.]
VQLSLAEALKQLQLLIDNKDFFQALALEQQILAEYPELNSLNKVSGDNVEAHNGVTAQLWKEFNVIQQQLHQAVR